MNVGAGFANIFRIYRWNIGKTSPYTTHIDNRIKPHPDKTRTSPHRQNTIKDLMGHL